ncbi:MAG: 8-oxo-dGTP diphosphatase [Actinomycetota bacterium]|jgi:mutator protein MutT|nr:8-oxo-dGTP diphosphatase [Actinomycetota bacterium]
MTEGRPEIAVGAIVVVEGRLLMVRRGHEPNKGLWTVPGGRVERGESLEDAVKREIREETGLAVEVGRLAGHLEYIGEHHLVILDFLAQPQDGSEPVAGDDADEVRWVPLDEIANLDCTPRFVELLTEWGVLP